MNNDYDTAPGFVRLRVGDVLLIERHEHIVDLVNESRARCINTASKHTISIATSVERFTILERRGFAGLQQFLASRTKRVATNETTTEREVMSGSKKTKKAKMNKPRARGGLAAAAMEANEKRGTKPKAERKPRTPKNGNGDHKKPAKTFIEELLNGGKTTREEAVALVMADYGVTEKAAKGAVGNARHYQKKEGRPVGEWKKAEKAEAEATTA